MLLYITVLIFFYLVLFAPAFFECRLGAYFIVIILLYLFRHKEKIRLALLFSALLFSLFSSSLGRSEFKSLIPLSNITGIYGRVETEPNRRKNRYIGFSLSLESVQNKRGDFFSSSGKIYVISPDIKITKGEMVYLEGEMYESFFLSRSGTVIERSVIGRVRRKVNALFIKSLPQGDVGNIVSLLLTGTTLDGDDTLSKRVRELGLSHLISLSGMHLAYLSSALMPLLSLFLEKKKAKRAKNLVLLLFVYLAGSRPSLVRSLIFVFLIPLFGIEISFILSLVVLIRIFPFYADEIATVLSFTSLSGLLLISPLLDKVKKLRVNALDIILSSIAATAASSPIVFTVFSSWQPYSFLFSIIGMPLIALLFLLIIVRFIIPKTDVLISIILYIVDKSSFLTRYFPLSGSFGSYYLIFSIFALSVVLSFVIRRRNR